MSPPRVPEGYVVERVLSPGPTTLVALARGPDGGACVLKIAATERAIPALDREGAVLAALAQAGVTGVPRLLHAWGGGVALEWLAMRTLSDAGPALRQRRELRDATARGVFATLASVHAARDSRAVPLEVVHGDVSPDNLYVSTEDAQTAIADFGLAIWRESPPSEESVRGAFRGTLAYAAPEVARSEGFDGRADDFALAASMLHVVTGIPLRETTGAPAVMLVDAGTRPLDASHPWRHLARKLFDHAIAEALLACLAFDPCDRPPETPKP
ncbi:MAG: protein kinase domain-containing protein [Polyangiaceae bacterium]|jgi:hypothetical protein